MTYSFRVLTLFPEYFQTPLETSILRRAQSQGLIRVELDNFRDYATDRHNTVDDLPYGGGPGMVLKPEPLVAGLEAARREHPEALRVYLTPQGAPFTHERAQRYAEETGLILVCGHYEGVDERVRQGWIDEEVSVGDYVLTGGEPAAMILIDAVARLRDGVLGNAASARDESFSEGLLEYPHYTRPRLFRDREVPEVLLSGHHEEIARWRRQRALERTAEIRPDLPGLLSPAEGEGRSS
jgi:tRNA (guanine37-N1)-methyltransferase